VDKRTLISNFKLVVSEMLKSATVIEADSFGVAIYNSDGEWTMSISYGELLKHPTKNGLEKLLTERIYDGVF
jgi:hypothetical protein